MLLLIATQSLSLAQELALKSKYSYSTPDLEAAQQLYSQRKYPEALAAFEAIITQAEAQQNYEEIVYAMEKKALALRRLNKYDQAIDTIEEAIRLAQLELPKEHILISRTYYTRGVLDHRLGNFYQARSYFDTALVYYDNAVQYDSAGYNRLIQYKYYAYQYSEGSQDTLLKYLDKLVELEELKPTPSRDEILILLQSYPTIYTQKGDFEQALSYAIQGYKYAKDHREEVSDRYFAESQYYLARVLYNKKDHRRAIDIGEEAMPLVEKIPRNQMPEYYSFNNLMGIAYMAVGKPQKALPFLTKAIELPIEDSRGNTIRNSLRFRAQVKINLGLCYLNLGADEKGKRFLDESLAEMKNLVTSPNSNLRVNYKHLGDYYFNKRDWKESLIMYDSALRNSIPSYTSELHGFPPTENVDFSYEDLRILQKKASSMKNAAFNDYSTEEALLSSRKYILETHKLLLSRRKELLATQGKLFLSENFKRLYENGLDISFKLYKSTGNKEYFNDAMGFASNSKAILFLEQSNEFDLVNNDQLNIDIKELFFKAKNNVERLQKIFDGLIDKSVTSDSVITINDQLLLARNDVQEVRDTVEFLLTQFDSKNSFVELLNNSKTPNLKKSQALVEFFYGEEDIYILAKIDDRQSFNRVKLDEQLLASIEQVIALVSKAPKAEEIRGQATVFHNESASVFDKLLRPTFDELDIESGHLIIVPDEILSRLPFETLVMEGGPSSFDELSYLVKQFSVQYQLSTQLLSNSWDKDKAGKGLLGIGFKQEGETSYDRGSYESLPGTEKEIRFLEASVPGTYLIGANGTKTEFLDKAKDYDILHLAIHGQADTVSRYESSLIFNGQEDNILNTDDLYRADLRARLAVLSACESGIGVLNKGEGTFSIARGFALVGVPSVVMSLWKVNDQITSEIMVDMYESFRESHTINESLRQAKLNYLERSDEYSAHPYYWAAFLQLGENVRKDQRKSGWTLGQVTLLSIAALSLLTIIALLLIKRKRAI
ncbi:CHAT domain-containing protein [Roseivirga sp. E12]|uniref:CHAT domain-containing protein n=1 Tax=Roseivirga sp. E12 TaxID=2819237 RepID=UPI001ABC9FC6|nr:CHAT domain-containing protein [Roseivirga sp. E12]MBO3698726.1 CHAT domain-containing protein [Roseivirga sp. E12]